VDLRSHLFNHDLIRTDIGRQPLQAPNEGNLSVKSHLLARLRLGDLHDNDRRIARGTLVVAAVGLIAKVSVALREVVIAWRFGTSAAVDSYQIAYMVVTWVPIMVVAIGSSVLIPRLVALRLDPERRDRFTRELNIATVLSGAALTFLVLVGGSHVVRWVGHGLDSHTQHMAVTMVRWFAPISLATVIGGQLAIRLQARERYASGIAEAAPALTAVLFILFWPSVGVTPLLLGITIGAFAQVIVLLPMTGRAEGGLGGFRFGPASGVWTTLYGSLALVAFGQFILGLTLPIDQAFASGLGEGALATLGYANRLLGLPTGLMVILTRAFLPVLSGAVADGHMELGRRQTLRWALLMAAGGAAGLAIGWIAAPAMITLLFQRGAFTPEDSANLAIAVRLGLFQLPFFFGGMVLVQWFAAASRFDQLLYVTIVALGVKLMLNFLLVPIFGLPGVLLATSGMYAASFLVSSVLLYTTKW
jgi:putative peptidoglycan lipid II flippase